MVINETIQDDNKLPAVVDAEEIENLVYVIRGRQVLLDSDLARLYQVETKYLNRAASRNILRFPEDFRFQLTEQEYADLRFQIGTSNENGRGGRRYYPYAYTEQGISMLASVLHSEVAVQASIGIMRAFVEMRRFLSNSSLILNRVNEIEVKQLEYQKQTDEKFERVFQYIDDHAESEQKIFFDGQIYDAFSLLVSLIQKATSSIVLIDGYVDVNTLNILCKKTEGVKVAIYTLPRTALSEADITTFNAQYPSLTVEQTRVFHDRFLIIDNDTVYHIGASLKDAGKKCFGISLIQDPGLVADLQNRLKDL